MANIQSGGDTGVQQGKTSRFNALDWIAMALMIIGGVNWGLVGLFDFDLVAAIFGGMTTPSRVVYAVVGLAALYSIYLCSTKLPKRT